MTFKDALHILSTNLMLKITLPDWAKYLTKKKREVDLAFTELKVCHFKSYNCVCVVYTLYVEQQYILEMVESRRNGDKVEQRYDLFSGLLDAAQGEQGSEAVLNDDEFMGGCSTSGSFGIRGKLEASYPPFQETCLYFLLLDMRCDILPFPKILTQNSSLQTTAHTLCFTFALLALYPDEQERLYQHIKGVMSSLNGMPVSSRNSNAYRELTSH